MQIEKTRRHGWQFPLHPLQIVGMGVYGFLIVAFYSFLGPFLGNKVVENTVLTLFTFAAFSVIALYIRCTATDPSDKASKKKKRGAKAKGFSKLNYGFILSQMILRFFRRLEKKILRHCIRRRYLDPWKTSIQMEPLLPFPLVVDDSIMPDLKDEDITFCSLCDFEVQKLSKHCRSCNRCVEGFDHHCRWLNNCIGKKNYTTFILLMFFVLLMLLVEGVSAIAIFIRCFANGKGIEKELEHKLNIMLPRGVLAAISAFLTLMTAYSLAALGQLFFFHIVLIRKGMRTYDYILAMKEENQSIELYDDSSSSSSDESIDFKSSEKSTFASRFICNGCKTDKSIRRLSIRVDSESSDPSSPNKKPFRASIDPWKLIKMSKEKALMAAEKARERIAKRAHSTESEPSASLKPMPSETKCGPSMNPEKDSDQASSPSVVSRGWLGSTSRLFSSPRRRVSGSPTAFSGVVPSPKQNYRSNFDLKLTGVSRELETYISRQVLCSVLKKSGEEESPR